MSQSQKHNTHYRESKGMDGGLYLTNDRVSQVKMTEQEGIDRARKELMGWIDKDVEFTNKPKQIAKEGFWLVPPSERPARWEKMGLKEPAPSEQNKKEGLC